AAGQAAGENAVPRPMVVSEVNPVNDEPNGRQWFVGEGVCGFAWVNVRPGTSSFARWLKKEGLARRDNYLGGVTVNVPQFNQSYERKMAFASAFAGVLQSADVLTSAGVTAYASGRLD
ncbi:MAG: hypothetical protein KAI64_04060, partial [Thermoplasmata archaeon]|nr:hypothetical protein [Thermoplasmata archaeon]